MSRAGQYRHRIDIQDWTEVRDEDTGGFTEDWVTVFENVPARIAPASGLRFIAAETCGALLGVVLHRALRHGAATGGDRASVLSSAPPDI